MWLVTYYPVSSLQFFPYILLLVAVLMYTPALFWRFSAAPLLQSDLSFLMEELDRSYNRAVTLAKRMATSDGYSTPEINSELQRKTGVRIPLGSDLASHKKTGLSLCSVWNLWQFWGGSLAAVVCEIYDYWEGSLAAVVSKSVSQNQLHTSNYLEMNSGPDLTCWNKRTLSNPAHFTHSWQQYLYWLLFFPSKHWWTVPTDSRLMQWDYLAGKPHFCWFSDIKAV